MCAHHFGDAFFYAAIYLLITQRVILHHADQTDLTANNDGTGDCTVLTIATTKPVTIKKLKITNGNASYKGGGINASAGTDVTLGAGALITGNKAYQKGGGVYVEGTSSSKAKLTMIRMQKSLFRVRLRRRKVLVAKSQ